VGLRVHHRVKKKLHDLETSSFNHYKKNSSLSHLQKKTMATVFWNYEGLLLCEFLPPKTTINSDEYCRTLERLCEAIK
jgi:hypothetical protein